MEKTKYSETILECHCGERLKVVSEPKGKTKDDKPTKKLRTVLICPKCGKRYGEI